MKRWLSALGIISAVAGVAALALYIQNKDLHAINTALAQDKENLLQEKQQDQNKIMNLQNTINQTYQEMEALRRQVDILKKVAT